MRLRDFFEEFYSDDNIHIVTVPYCKWYFLLGNTGQIADQTALYSLSPEQATALAYGKLTKDELDLKWDRPIILDDFETYFTEENLKELENARNKK